MLYSSVGVVATIGKNDNKKGSTLDLIPAENIIIHPNFISSSTFNDIALIKTPQITFSGNNLNKKLT